MAKKEFATVQELKEYFGEVGSVSRPDIAQFEKATGKYAPKEIWDNKLKRGLYSLDFSGATRVEQVEVHTKVQEQHVDIVVPKQEMVAREIDVFESESFIPSVDPVFVPHGAYSVIEKLIRSKKFFTMYLTGESGTGKNKCIEQACAKIRRPVIRVQITRDTKESDIIGSKTLIDGNIVYEDGPVIWAAKSGAVLILDELDAGDPNEVMCLQRILEGGEFFVKSLNRMIVPAEGFAIISTSNTRGQGSDSGRWIGTGVLNAAFLDRFSMCLEQPYPSKKIEQEILENAYRKYSPTGEIDSPFIEKLVEWVQVIRRTADNGGIDDIISTRRAISIVQSRALWFDGNTAVEYGISRYDETTRDAFKTLWEKMQTGEIVPQ